MAEEGTNIPLVMPVTPYDDLHVDFNPESQIITKMMANDEISPTITVDEIVALSSTLAATSSKSDLQQHATNVSVTILTIAMRVPHDKQSKLVDFCFRLHLHTIADPINGGAVSPSAPGEVLWSKWPRLDFFAALYEFTNFADGIDAGDSQKYQNYAAWRAQLSELGFSLWKEEPVFTYMHLTAVFRENFDCSEKRDAVRLMCMWFIYAPNKVWLDIQLRRSLNTNLDTVDRFQRSFWPRWKELFKGCQELEVDQDEDLLSDDEDEDMLSNDDDDDTELASAQDLSDEDTQDLIRRALEKMEEVEAEHAISSGELSITQRATD